MRALTACLVTVLLAAAAIPAGADEDGARTVRARVQPRPGAEPVEIEMKVHAAPTELALVEADAAGLPDSALVLGVVVDSQAVAFPMRYLANYEVVNGRVGKTPIAPSW